MTIIRSNSISGINSITAQASSLAFYDSTGSLLSVDTGNVNAGVLTATTVRVTGDLTVEGTTTTLDTVVTEVDKLEVNANNSTVGVAITQSGAGDILRLYDGASQVVTVDDQGNFGIGNVTPNAKLEVSGDAIFTQTSASIQTDCLQLGFTSPNGFIKSKNTSGAPASNLDFYSTDTSGNTNLGIRLRYTGNVGIGTDNPQGKLVVSNGSAGLEFNPNSGQAIVSYNRITSAYTPIGLQGSTVGLYIGGVGEALHISNTGNIGIGTNNPFDSKLQVFGKQRVSASAKNLTTDFFVLSSNDNSSTRNELIFRQRASDNDWEIEAVEQNTGYHNVWIKNGNLKFTSGKGIDFSATADGSGTDSSELLDDYEEGTFTAEINFDNLSLSSHTTSNGFYVKVGRHVRCDIWIRFSGSNLSGTPVANAGVWISGLPYAGQIPSRTTQWVGNPVAMGRLPEYRGRNDSTDFNKVYLYMGDNSSVIYLGVNKDPQSPISTDFLYGMSEKSFSSLIGAGYIFELRTSFSYMAAP